MHNTVSYPQSHMLSHQCEQGSHALERLLQIQIIPVVVATVLHTAVALITTRVTGRQFRRRKIVAKTVNECVIVS